MIAIHDTKKKQNGKPKFKSKKNEVQSYTTKMINGNIQIDGNKIKLPKLGWFRFAKSLEINGAIKKVTLRRNAAGKYFVTILVKEEVNELPKTKSEIGIDVGLKDFAILSDGTVHENPKFFRSVEQKLVCEQQNLSRRTDGSLIG